MNDSPKSTPKPKLDLSRRKSGRQSMSLYAEGEPMVWLTGGSLAFALLMILLMLAYVFWMGFSNFWPQKVARVTTHTGETFMGSISRVQTYTPSTATIQALPDTIRERVRQELAETEGVAGRTLLYTGNYDITGERFQWVSDYRVKEVEYPEWALLIHRMEWGNFYGEPVAFEIDGEPVATGGQAIWDKLSTVHEDVTRRRAERRKLESREIGRVNRQQEQARLDYVDATRQHLAGQIDDAALESVRKATDEVEALARNEHARITEKIQALNQENRRYVLRMRTVDGVEVPLQLDHIVLAYPANNMNFLQKLGVFGWRWNEFLFDNPREANAEGGVYPAIIGTVTMTLVMSIFVVPFGVLAALYLREYAKPGPIVSAVRIAINNLAGVPSIVFGVFGLGFFCYIMGGHMDEWFYAARLPSPTFRKGGVLWASATLALLTLPVVIVATEEALSSVPGSMREGSYACGASKWQTIKRIVLPRAMPGIMTGMILAMARGAGEVAPLMLVGAVKLAPDLPLDFFNLSGSLGPIPTGPIHLDRSFMHLGFHIYDLGFQSSDSEAARPMVWTTTLLLISIIVLLNISAMIIRTRLRRKFQTGAF